MAQGSRCPRVCLISSMHEVSVYSSTLNSPFHSISSSHSSSISSSFCCPSTSTRSSSKIQCATSPRRWGQLTSPSPTQSLEERLLVQHPRWLGRGETSPRTRARAKTTRIRPQPTAAVEQRQEECEVLGLQRSGTLFLRLSEEEAELIGCGESGATIIILWCDWRDVERFLLE